MKKSLKIILLTTSIMGMSSLAIADSKDFSSNGAKHEEHKHCTHHCLMVKHMFKEQDSNDDGVITRAEYDAYKNKEFKEMDANHNGKLTKKEVKAYFEKKDKKMKCGDHKNDNRK